jgi:hypothetical protein
MMTDCWSCGPIISSGRLGSNTFVAKNIEEGIQKSYFHVIHPRATLNVVLAIMQCLVDVIYDKSPEDLIESPVKISGRSLRDATWSHTYQLMIETLFSKLEWTLFFQHIN